MKLKVLHSIILVVVLTLLAGNAGVAFASGIPDDAAPAAVVQEEISGSTGPEEALPPGESANTTDDKEEPQPGGSAGVKADEKKLDGSAEGNPVQNMESTEPAGTEDDMDVTGGEVDEGEDIMFSPTAITAQGDLPADDDPNTVSTEADLKSWLNTNKNGTVKLGADIALTTGAVYLLNPVTIDTGAFGLVFNKGYLLSIGSGAQIIGEGTRVPVVDAKDLGTFRAGSWMDPLITLNVTARGNGESGGTAMRIHGNNTDQDLYNVHNTGLEIGQISAFGNGAVGLDVMSNINLCGFTVSVAGEDSTAVKFHNGGNICISKLSAAGNGAQAASGTGVIEVDTCITQPEPQAENITVYQAQIIQAYYPVKQNGSANQLLTTQFPGSPLVGGGSISDGKSLYATWNEGQRTDIDLATAGDYKVAGILTPEWHQAFFSGTPEVTVEVRDPETPCIAKVRALSGNRIILMMWTPTEWSVEESILWYSDDNGKTWADYTDCEGVVAAQGTVGISGVDSMNGGFTISDSLAKNGVLFCVENPEGLKSNIVQFSSQGQAPDDYHGGDRTGADRLGVIFNWVMPDDADDEPSPPDDTDIPTTPVDPVTPVDPAIPVGPVDPETPGGVDEPTEKEPTDDDGGENTGVTDDNNGAGSTDSAVHYTLTVPSASIYLQPFGSLQSEQTVDVQGLPPAAQAQEDAAIISDNPIPAAGSSLAQEEQSLQPAAQPELGSKGVNARTAALVSTGVAGAGVGGWFWLKYLRKIKL